MSTEHENQLRITEIFHSLQGESTSAGLPTVFIRLTGCPLRCGYCDTEYAFSGGEWMDIADILERTAELASGAHVCVTGGEPLAQKNCLVLLSQLCDRDYTVSLETSGAVDISRVDERVSIVMDLKTPDSGEEPKNLLDNLQYLAMKDQLKFVICSHSDYSWAASMINQYQLQDRVQILLSPAWGLQNPSELAEWILNDGLQVRFQLQLHKLLWDEAEGR